MSLDAIHQNLIELNTKLDLFLLFRKGIVILSLAVALGGIWILQRNSWLGRMVGYCLRKLHNLLRIPDPESPYLTVFGLF